MENRNPYDVLGVPPEASDSEIQAAYRARSLLFHPDRLADLPDSAREAAEREMKALNSAYAVLKDARKRAALDRKLNTVKSVTVARPPQAPEVEPEPSPEDDVTREGRATHYQPAVAVRVTAPPISGRYSQTFASYPPYTPAPQKPEPAPPPALGRLLTEDGLRFVTVAGLTSLGWFAIILADMSAPGWVTLAAAVGFGAALMVILSFIKPAHKRRPLSVASLLGRALLMALVPIVLVAVVVFLQISADFGNGALQVMSVVAGLAFAMLVHWGVCLASYLLT